MAVCNFIDLNALRFRCGLAAGDCNGFVQLPLEGAVELGVIACPKCGRTMNLNGYRESIEAFGVSVLQLQRQIQITLIVTD